MRDGEERIEPLRNAPGQTFLLGFGLRIPRGHVDGEEVGGDAGVGGARVMLGEVTEGAADDETEFHFVV